MRTIEDIKKEMTDAVLANETLRYKFGLDPDVEWSQQVSAVSVLNLIIYIVAVGNATMEWLFDRLKNDVERRIAAALPGTSGWYWNRIMEFQCGDAVNEFGGYDTMDESKRIVRHCAIVERDNGIVVKVNKGTNTFDTLTAEELAALTEYVNLIKFAGTVAEVYSYPPDEVTLRLNVWRDPQTLRPDMTLIDGSTAVVYNAVKSYLENIKHGGVFNKTALIDAVQAVVGVEDVTIDSGHIYSPGDQSATDMADTDQNFRSVGGHFKLVGLAFNDKIS